MNAEEIQKLLDEASGFYNDGNYDDAIMTWNRILEADPENERALEGIKMAQLLTTEWETVPPRAEPEPASPPQPTPGPPGAAMDPALVARIREAIGRVQELIASGNMEAAREGVEALQQAAPDSVEVLACAARVEAEGNPQHYVEEQMALVRHFMILGDTTEAYRACRKVLSLEPDNAAAREILMAAAGAMPAPAPAGPPGIPVSQELGALELTDVALPQTAPAEVPPLDLSLEEPTEEELPPLTLTQTAAMGSGATDVPASASSVEASPLDLSLDDLAVEPAAPGAPDAEDAPAAQIDGLLHQGDRLRDEGDLDAAISAWSRIFVIQETHEEAEQRIDAARRALEEQAREIESALYRGEDLLGAGNLQDARDAFVAVLQLRENHAEAQARIAEIDRKLRGEETEPVSAPAPPPASHVPKSTTTPAAAHDAMPSTDSIPLVAPLDEIAPPTEPLPRVPGVSSAPAKARGAGRGRALGLLAAAVLVLGVGGFFAWKTFFPANPGLSSAGPAGEGGAAGIAAPAPAGQEQGSATGAGDADPAPIPVAPAPVAAAPEVGSDGGNSSPERSGELLQAGIALFESGDYSGAVTRMRAAVQADPMNFEAQDWVSRAGAELDRVERHEADVAAIRTMFEERDFHNALYKLYRLETEHPEERARIDAWIATCWYDWGVFLMKARNPAEAEQKLQEAVTARPDDTEAVEHLEVARRYTSRQPDAAYETYISRLAARPLE